MTELSHGHDIITIGASSGGVGALGNLVRALPADLPAAVFVVLHDSDLLLRRGPRENMSRPAIDPLFRSAGATFGGRVIGVILTGALNDGSSGLRAIKRCGGVAVVQDPKDADFDEMPRNALKHV